MKLKKEDTLWIINKTNHKYLTRDWLRDTYIYRSSCWCRYILPNAIVLTFLMLEFTWLQNSVSLTSVDIYFFQGEGVQRIVQGITVFVIGGGPGTIYMCWIFQEGGRGWTPPPPEPPSRSVDDLAMVKSKDLASAPLWHIVDTK